jgi:hypothetical protein
MSSTFSFGTKLKFSLRSTDPLETQTTELLNDIAQTAPGQTGFIVVGHSQGGLIGRRAAQRSSSGFITGVVTIGSPHIGTIIARNARQTVSNTITERINHVADGSINPYQDVGCWIADQLIRRVVSTAVNYAADAAIPVSNDLRLHSAFVDNTLNPNFETFRRAGLQSYARKRWVLMRLLGDNIAYPDGSTGGRAMVRYTQWGYDGFRTCEYVAIFFGDFNVSHECGYIADRMNDVDVFWDRLTAPGDYSDGIVQGASQVYPATPGSSPPQQYPINDGDSHLGETSSDKTKLRLTNALSGQFNVPIR